MNNGSSQRRSATLRSATPWLSTLLLGILLLGNGKLGAQESEGSVLFVAPHRLIIQAGEKAETVTVSNKSKEARRYDLLFIDQVMDDKGVTQRKDTFPYTVQKMVHFQPKRFTLKPDETQTVRVVVDRPAGLADGDYHSHLLFREVPLGEKDKQQLPPQTADKKAVTFEIRTLYGIAVPVIVEQGRIASDIAMGDATLGRNAESKMKQVTVTFKRTGNAEAAAKLSIDYVAPGRKPVSAIEPQWIRMYREVDKITKTLDLAGLPAGAEGGKLVLTFAQEKDEHHPAPPAPAVKEIPFK
jgi:hypothetical protein